MKILFSTLFISLIISILSTQPIIPEEEKKIEEYYLSTPLLKNTLGAKSLEVLNPILKVTLLPDGEENEYSFTLKANNLPSDKYYTTYTITYGKNGTYSLLNVEFKKKEGECILKNKKFIFNFKLYNEEEIDIILTYKIYNPNLFELYRFEHISLNFGKGNEGLIEVTCKNNVSCIGTKNGILKKKENNLYEYKGKINENGISDYIIVGYGSAKWKANIEGYIIKNSIFDIIKVKFETPKYFIGGDNKIKSYNISNNVAEKIDNVNIIDKHNKFIFESYTLMSKKIFYKFEVEFSNIVKSNWDFYYKKEYYPEMYKSSKIIKKAKEILINDKSNEPKYIKLGRWVYKNMKYDMKYFGKRMSPEEILNKLKGVCEHYSILYNALLNSIGIKAIYTTGYAYNSKEKLLNNPLDNYHAWTIAFIDNKWIPLDSTWGIFEGKLPLSHVFDTFIKSEVIYSTCSNCHFQREHKLQLLGYDQENDQMK
jgi:hypothetical protein